MKYRLIGTGASNSLVMGIVVVVLLIFAVAGFFLYPTIFHETPKTVTLTELSTITSTSAVTSTVTSTVTVTQTQTKVSYGTTLTILTYIMQLPLLWETVTKSRS
jgi:uncharacterized protein (DUF58 family)